MIRAVLAVATAVALLAVSGPALADARADTTADRVATAGERLDRAAADLAADSTAVRPGEPAARRTVSLSIPDGFAAASVAFVGIGSPSALRDAGGGSASSGGGEESPPDTTDEARNGTGPHTRETRDVNATTALGYRIRGKPLRTVPLPNVATREGEMLRLGPGAVRVRLRSVRIDGTPSIVASRPDA